MAAGDAWARSGRVKRIETRHLRWPGRSSRMNSGTQKLAWLTSARHGATAAVKSLRQQFHKSGEVRFVEFSWSAGTATAAARAVAKLDRAGIRQPVDRLAGFTEVSPMGDVAGILTEKMKPRRTSDAHLRKVAGVCGGKTCCWSRST
jgi:hypothetical protein